MKGLRRCSWFAASVRITSGTGSCEQVSNEAGFVLAELSRLEMLRKHSTREATHFLTGTFEVFPGFGELGWCRVFDHEPPNHATGECLPCGTCFFKRSSRAGELRVGVVGRPDARSVVRTSICLSEQARPLVETRRPPRTRRIPFERVGHAET